jgi:beta-glucanase (GH16 family)
MHQPKVFLVAATIGALVVVAAACSSGVDPGTPSATPASDASAPPVWSPPDASPPPAPVFDAGPPAAEASAGAKGDAAPPPDARADAATDAAPPNVIDGYVLVWSDEFNGADGTPPDPAKWTHETGGNNANQELEYYSDSIDNSQQHGGNLVITATTDGNGNYTSARINTAGQFTQTYGRFEARAQLPYGQGIWPAFWMLGANIGNVGWPACGEIDIMETIGTDVGENHGSLHSPGWDPSGVQPLPGGASYADGFHTFAIEWDPGEIRFYVDDVLYETQDQNGAPGGAWVFDGQPFFIILNVAVGGNWPGNPDSTTVFPQKLLVDYVRVYQKKGP